MPYDKKSVAKDHGYVDNYGARFYPHGATAEEVLARDRGKKRAHMRHARRRSYRRATGKR